MSKPKLQTFLKPSHVSSSWFVVGNKIKIHEIYTNAVYLSSSADRGICAKGKKLSLLAPYYHLANTLSAHKHCSRLFHVHMYINTKYNFRYCDPGAMNSRKILPSCAFNAKSHPQPFFPLSFPNARCTCLNLRPVISVQTKIYYYLVSSIFTLSEFYTYFYFFIAFKFAEWFQNF